MKVIAIIVLVVLGLFVVIGSIRQRKLLVNKFVIIVALIAIGIISLSNTLAGSTPQKLETQYYQRIAPSVQDAPYIVPTSSRAYYVSTFNETTKGIVLTCYYYYNQKKWERSTIPLPLDKTLYGNLQVYKRKIGG